MPKQRKSRENDSGSETITAPPITGSNIDDSLVLHLIEALKDNRVMRALHADSDKLSDKINSLTALVTNLVH